LIVTLVVAADATLTVNSSKRLAARAARRIIDAIPSDTDPRRHLARGGNAPATDFGLKRRNA
jgi:hypothetical protein